MILNKLNTFEALLFSHDLQVMHELPKVGENYNHNLPKASKMTVTDNFELTNIKTLVQS